jgi:hypothetical protein
MRASPRHRATAVPTANPKQLTGGPIANFPGRPLDSVRGENETFGVIANSNGRRMGRYKDYREPKRRGYDDDYSPQDRVAERRGR